MAKEDNGLMSMAAAELGARLRRMSVDRYSVEFLNSDGSVRAVRPASLLEIRMWLAIQRMLEERTSLPAG